ncbi:MAG: hypothetical protein ACP5RZ_00450 [Thermoplasmata archaeon]
MYTVIDFAISMNDDGSYDFMTYGETKRIEKIEDMEDLILTLGDYFETEEAYNEKMEQLVKSWLDSKKKGYIIRIWKYQGGYDDFIYTFHIVGQGIDWMSPPSGTMNKLSEFVIKFINIVEEVVKKLKEETGEGLENKENMSRANVMIFMSLKTEGLI